MLLEERGIVSAVGVSTPDVEATTRVEYPSDVPEPRIEQSIELLVRDEVVGQGTILGPELLVRWRMLGFASLVIDTKRRSVALSTLEFLRGAVVGKR
jgi:hypothetical protein